MTSLVDDQKPFLYAIVDRRTDISTQLRRFMSESSVDSAEVLSLAEQYGELDGEIVYRIATNFAALQDSLSAVQETQLQALRTQILGDLAPAGAFLYSEPIAMPEIINTDFLFNDVAALTVNVVAAAVAENAGAAATTVTLSRNTSISAALTVNLAQRHQRSHGAGDGHDSRRSVVGDGEPGRGG